MQPVRGSVVVQNINTPGRTRRVNAVKYAAMRRALLRVLPIRPPGLTQSEMFKAVRRHLPERVFPGGATAGWWAKTVQLDLEAKGLVHRSADTRPLRWHRAGGSA
ncbi:MAG TPA: hypothetical protein VNL37_01895 [Candidatus Polarisedimenticolia bacterium]|nr:hypothetical protein [Candidatus Polarisedimenticolia bacterium]